MAGILAWSGIWSVRTAVADFWSRQETVSATREAIALIPDQAEYYVRLAKLLADSEPVAAHAALDHAVTLNPWDANSWIELGLTSEAAGDYEQAQSCLLHAAEVDRQYLPRWTLANFYFRRGEPLKFWRWAKAAAAVVHSDPSPLFGLCGKVAEDGNLIERLDIRTPGVRLAYLDYLLSHEGANLGPVIRAVLERHGDNDVSALLSVSDRLLSQDRVEEALTIWNSLSASRQIPYPALEPAAGRILTNANFALKREPHGFDWRLADIEGVTASQEESPAGLRLTFSGRQPETCEPLVQMMPVRGATWYEITLRYRSFSDPPNSGLRWRVTDASGTSLAEGTPLASADPTDSILRFRTSESSRLVRLALQYQRQPGTVRFEGYVVLFSAMATQR